MSNKKANQLADKWIAELLEMGCSYNEMPAVFKLARKKYNLLKHTTEMERTNQEIAEVIFAELRRAEEKHPAFPTDVIHQVAIMQEEAGEATRASLQLVYENGSLYNLQAELIQTAAMCIRVLKHM